MKYGLIAAKLLAAADYDRIADGYAAWVRQSPCIAWSDTLHGVCAAGIGIRHHRCCSGPA